MTRAVSRRDFLKTSTAGLATFAIGRSAPAVGDRLRHACIGVGGMGAVDLKHFIAHPKVQIAAICDVDQKRLDEAAALVPDARKYTDWRELIAKEGDAIDSLNVSVPDHMHAPITMTALRARKHVYCQKPLCHDVAECRAVAEAAKAARVVTQLGTQAASGLGDRMAVQYLKNEAVGKIKHVVLCSNRAGATEKYRLEGPRPAVGEAPPAGLDWDLWLGTAPERPYAAGLYHPMRWRAWQDFGTGWSGDIGCHVFDAVWKGLALTAPKTVVAEVQKSWRESPNRRADTWPQSNHITWTFPGNERTEGGELTVEWFDGEMFPPEEIRAVVELEKFPQESALVIGTEGALLLPNGGGPRLFPREKFEGRPRPQPTPRNHYHHFVDACLGGEPTESDFVRTGPMVEAILLGTVAVRVPETVLQWNAGDLTFRNSRAAHRLLHRRYRKGWTVAGL